MITKAADWAKYIQDFDDIEDIIKQAQLEVINAAKSEGFFGADKIKNQIESKE